jgi:hypothetical protein
MLTARNLKILAVSYAVKTVVFGVAWLFVPDLPQRAATLARDTWTWVAR